MTQQQLDALIRTLAAITDEVVAATAKVDAATYCYRESWHELHCARRAHREVVDLLAAKVLDLQCWVMAYEIPRMVDLALKDHATKPAT